ncbi:MAG: serine hydrolase [Phycisphaerales bacterium]
MIAGVVIAGCSNATSDVGSTTTVATPPTASVDLAALAPRSGYGIYDSGDGRCTLVAGDGLSSPVPVASVFKLWILDAVARSIESDDIGWDTSVAIRDTLRSDPSGEAYGYPTGQEVPVSKLAELMISISDNTATDHLIDLIGRKAVADVIRELAPDGAERTLPLLSTADMARLKFVHPNLGRQYAGLDPDARSQFVLTLPERGPFPWPDDPAAVNRLDLTTPSFIDKIEWFASGTDLCRTMVDLARLSNETGLEPLDGILSANPGLPPDQARAWTTTWFKGGSEPGVVTLAYRLATDDLDRVVVIALSDPDTPLTQQADGQQLVEAILGAAQH